jgi:hypothetical protein
MKVKVKVSMLLPSIKTTGFIIEMKVKCHVIK